MSRDNRIVWADLLRGMAVFAIVLGHTLRNATAVYPWLYSFHVPLCVMVSGIVFSRGIKSFGQYLSDKFRRLMIPYYAFALVSILLYEIMGNWMEDAVDGGYSVSFWQNLFGMVYANAGNGLMRWNMPLWYLPMIFVVVIVAWCVYRYDSGKWDFIVLASSVVVAIVLKTVVRLDGLPMGIETACYLFPFFALGKIVQRYRKLLEGTCVWSKLIAGVCLITAGTLLSTNNSLISYNADNYGKMGYVYFLTQGTLLCVGFSCLAAIKEKSGVIARWLSENTLGIMVMHKFPILFFVALLPMTKELVREAPLIGSILIACSSVVLCVVVSNIIVKVCPTLLGVRRKM